MASIDDLPRYHELRYPVLCAIRDLGGSGGDGFDGIGTAPITSVLSRTVAVQAKRYQPGKSVGRETVALFQSDAAAKGAEHGIQITTATFNSGARRTAVSRTPTIDLIDGDRLAELCLEQEVGVAMKPTVDRTLSQRWDTARPTKERAL